MAYDWGAARRRTLRKFFPMSFDPIPYTPPGWADGIIDAWARNGNMSDVFHYAKRLAKLHGEKDKLELFQAMHDQFASFVSEKR